MLSHLVKSITKGLSSSCTLPLSPHSLISCRTFFLDKSECFFNFVIIFSLRETVLWVLRAKQHLGLEGCFNHQASLRLHSASATVTTVMINRQDKKTKTSPQLEFLRS